MPVINSTNSIFQNGASYGFALVSGDKLTVEDDGFIIAAPGLSSWGVVALAALASNNYAVQVDGQVSTYNAGYSAIDISVGSASVVVAASGKVSAANAIAIAIGDAALIRNNGTIYSSAFAAIELQGGTSNQITNDTLGRIFSGNDSDYGIRLSNNAMNRIDNFGGFIGGILATGSSKEVILNQGIMETLRLSFGDDSILQSSDGYMQDVDLGGGNDTFQNSGKVVGLFAGDGNDTVRNEAGGTFQENRGVGVNLGGGNDKYFGNETDESVMGGLGADMVGLGGGNDKYVGYSGTGDAADTINASSGFDDYWVWSGIAPPASAGVVINIDTVNHGTALAQRAVSSITGTDTILGFENAYGYSGNDAIHGSAVANTLGGDGGNDALYGYGGNDRLNGDEGNDYLRGGRGADQLTGGAGRDGFVFDTAAISAEADNINDFTAVDDAIWLDNAVFPLLGAGGVLNAAFFKAFTATSQLDSNDLVAYQTTTGNLYVDMNGAAAGGWAQIATLATKPVITAADFIVF
jgi:Ca2+-binding RTX toxin-like protein